MDYMGIKNYVLDKYYRFKSWCELPRGTYYNKDVLMDILQLVLIVVLIILDLT